MDDFSNSIFPIIRHPQPPDPYKGEQVVDEPGICMRLGCDRARWVHPEKGDLVLCVDHAEEVFAGHAKAPPLLRVRDYQSSARKTFLVEDLGPYLKSE